MAGFGTRVLATDPYLSAPPSDSEVEITDLDRLLRESDLISLHVPLTRETRGLIGEAAFRAMKPTALVVNTSRGPVIDEAALIRALREKWIAGAALDWSRKKKPAAEEFADAILPMAHAPLDVHPRARSGTRGILNLAKI